MNEVHISYTAYTHVQRNQTETTLIFPPSKAIPRSSIGLHALPDEKTFISMMSRSRHAVESCMSQLQEWKPFQIDPPHPPPMSVVQTPYPLYSNKHSVSDPSTDRGAEVASMDFSRLTLADGPKVFQYLERKRRRPGTGSRSVSGRSSDRSGRRTKRCCSVGGGGSGAYATCSDFPVLGGGTDSSGEMFTNGDVNWGSDASEARISRNDVRDVGGGGGGSVMERDGMGFMVFQSCIGVTSDLSVNDPGYGSETGYKGDAEFGYDEFDEEEDDGRLSFWDNRVGDHNRMELVSSTTTTTTFHDKSHSRCRRKKDFGNYLSIRKIKRA